VGFLNFFLKTSKKFFFTMASRIRDSMATDFDNLADCLITVDADSRSV